MTKTYKEINPDSEEKEILEYIQGVMENTKTTGQNELPRRSIEIEYGFNILNIKQQKKLLDDQNKFNEDLLRNQNVSSEKANATNRKLVCATWALVLATLIVAIIFH